MLTVIVRAGVQPLPLIETLTPLVSGVVKGLVGRSYIVCEQDHASGPNADIIGVSQEAGADIVMSSGWAAGLEDAAHRSRSASHCIVIDAGVLIDPSFWPAVERFLRLASAKSGLVAATTAKHGFAARALRSLDRISGKADADQVMLVPPAAIIGDVWNKRYGRNLILMESISQRLTL